MAMKKAMKATKKKEMHKVRDSVFYYGLEKSGWAGKTLYVAGRKNKSGTSRWFGRFKWDTYAEAKPGTTYAPRPSKTMDAAGTTAPEKMQQKLLQMQEQVQKMMALQKAKKTTKAMKAMK